MQTDSAQLELLYGVVALLLPDGILDHFEIVNLDEEDVPAPADGLYTPYKRKVHLYLDEQDMRTAAELATLRPNGFTEYTSVADYPVRNRLLTLHMRRRRYIGPDEKNTIPCICNADWLTKMPRLMNEKPTLFAVGAGHLLGEKGVLNLLRQEGYTVESVKNK